MEKITDRQLEALRTFAGMIAPRGPTVRELGRALGLKSTMSVQALLLRLRDQGLLRQAASHRPGQGRAWTITEKGRRLLEETAPSE